MLFGLLQFLGNIFQNYTPEEFTKDVKIIVLTSSFSESNVKVASAPGCDEYLIQPYTPEKYKLN